MSKNTCPCCKGEAEYLDIPSHKSNILCVGCEIKYLVGTKVTVDIKSLYDHDIVPDCGWINTENNDNGEIGYYDLWTNDGLVCMDGETCEIVDIKSDGIVLKNTDGEEEREFSLTFEEAEICCFKCPK